MKPVRPKRKKTGKHVTPRARQMKLLGEAKEPRERKEVREIEAWIAQAPDKWRDALEFFISCGVPKERAIIPAWWSLGKRDRNAARFPTETALADWLGISRPTFDKWQNETYGDPPLSLRDIGKRAHDRFFEQAGPDVDAAFIRQLVRGDASAGHYQLYYRMVGKVTDEGKLHLMGADDGPVEIRRADELSDEELAAIAASGGRGTAGEKAGA